MKDLTIYIAFTASIPMMIYLGIKLGFSQMVIAYIFIGFLGLYLLIKTYKENKLERQTMKEIKEKIRWAY